MRAPTAASCASDCAPCAVTLACAVRMSALRTSFPHQPPADKQARHRIALQHMHPVEDEQTGRQTDRPWSVRWRSWRGARRPPAPDRRCGQAGLARTESHPQPPAPPSRSAFHFEQQINQSVKSVNQASSARGADQAGRRASTGEAERDTDHGEWRADGRGQRLHVGEHVEPLFHEQLLQH